MTSERYSGGKLWKKKKESYNTRFPYRGKHNKYNTSSSTNTPSTSPDHSTSSTNHPTSTDHSTSSTNQDPASSLQFIPQRHLEPLADPLTDFTDPLLQPPTEPFEEGPSLVSTNSSISLNLSNSSSLSEPHSLESSTPSPPPPDTSSIQASLDESANAVIDLCLYFYMNVSFLFCISDYFILNLFQFYLF